MSGLMKANLRLQMCTIRGMIKMLEAKKKVPKNSKDKPWWWKHLQFYSLRGHGVLNNEPVTEQIYIHSKVMIVDDDKVIIGSANINDRSMNGDRDSEICALIQDENKMTIKVGPKKDKLVKVSTNVHELRMKLWKEHLGLSSQEMDLIKDPLEFDIWSQASINTKLFREIFACFPDNKLKRYKEAKHVTEQWLVDSLKMKKIQDERLYRIK